MATLDELGTFLATACSLTVGADLFKGQLPTAPDLCMGLYEYGGSAPEFTFGRAAIATDHPRVQVVVRGAAGDYATPRAVAETAYRACAAALPQSISGTGYLAILPLQPPFLLAKDERGRVSVAFNLHLWKGLSA